LKLAVVHHTALFKNNIFELPWVQSRAERLPAKISLRVFELLRRNDDFSFLLNGGLDFGLTSMNQTAQKSVLRFSLWM